MAASTINKNNKAQLEHEGEHAAEQSQEQQSQKNVLQQVKTQKRDRNAAVDNKERQTRIHDHTQNDSRSDNNLIRWQAETKNGRCICMYYIELKKAWREGNDKRVMTLGKCGRIGHEKHAALNSAKKMVVLNLRSNERRTKET